MVSVDCQVLDVDYVLLQEKPVVRIFGKTRDSQTVCAFYDQFSPFFYVDREDAIEMLKEEPQVQSVQKIKRKLVMGYQQERAVWKVTLQNPAKTPEVRQRVLDAGFKVYEADILFKYRYMSDHGVKGMDWVRIEGGTTNTNTVRSKIMLSAKSVEPIVCYDDVPLRVLSFDIECVATKEGTVPEAKYDPVVMISLVFSEPFQGSDSLVLATRPGAGVHPCADEKELLEEFNRFINEYDPDIITGFNINNFDLPYVFERMAKCGVRAVFGRCTTKQALSKKIGITYRNSVTGRVIADVFQLVKKDFMLKRYSLNAVSEDLLGEQKEDVKHSEIGKYYRGDAAQFEKLASYCRKDSLLALDLLLKKKLLDKYIALSKVSGILLQDSLSGGETTRIENFLLREFNRKGFIFPLKPQDKTIGNRESRQRKELGGGFVIEPVRELHSNVAVLDFKSMYPSIILSYNICPTTLIIGDEKIEGALKPPGTANFVPPEVRKGIIPGILKTLLDDRGKVKKKLRKIQDDNLYRVLYAKQWALKIMANAFYGYLGYARAVIYNLDIANAITASGRESIKFTAKTVQEKYGLPVVYGDTDSVFVKMKDEDFDKIEQKATEICTDINTQLPGVMELEFEKIFKRFLPLAKKRYAAWKFEHTEDGWKESIETKGIETVRRDWCPLVGEVVAEVLEILLKEQDIKKAVTYVKGIVIDLNEGRIPINKLIVTKTMTKAGKSYKGIQPHVELVKKMEARSPGEAPGVGDRIPYVIVRGSQLVSHRAEDPVYIQEHGLPVDATYYIENQMLPPLERIFDVLGVDRMELLGNGRQMGLLDILKKNKKPQGPREIPAAEFNGFMCKKCSAFFEQVPLSGACTCGGALLFSSPKGPGEVLVR
ncbi:MAG: DNA-directed DNA polymerase [Nanoarchaeota archaeon]|nr:DNA-directed DNA polymerase [Nanoarchaeota archaeon]